MVGAMGLYWNGQLDGYVLDKLMDVAAFISGW